MFIDGSQGGLERPICWLVGSGVQQKAGFVGLFDLCGFLFWAMRSEQETRRHRQVSSVVELLCRVHACT